MLRTQLVREIHEQLDKGPYFSSSDFTVTSSGEKDGTGLLEVRYRFDDAFFLKARIPPKATARASYGDSYDISCTFSPGGLTTVETAKLSNKTELLATIASWLGSLRSEIVAAPGIREVTNAARDLETLLAQVDDLPDEYFTREEANELKKRLDELESQLKANIERSTEDRKAAKVETDALHADVVLLKQTVESLKKKGWAGSLLVRMKKWSSNPENRDLLKTGASVARTLLLGDGK